jgi:hypothetical protein
MKNQLSPILKLNNKTIKIPTIPSVVLDTDKTNDKHVTQTRPIEPTADLNCVQQLVLADIKNLPSQLTYVDNNPFLSYIVPGDRNWFFSFAKYIWLQQSSHCTLSSFNASSPTCIDILLSRNHFSPLKRVPPNTDNSFDILKNQLKRQGQQNKTSNNKKKVNCQPKLHHI